MKKALLILVVLLINGCAALPKSEFIQSFGAATAQTTSTLSDSFKTMNTLALRADREQQAVRYITRQNPIHLSPAPNALLEPKATAARVTALRAVTAYGAALATTASDAQVQKLERAAIALGAAVEKFKAFGPPGSQPLIGPVIKFASRSFGIFLGQQYIAEIEAVIRDTHPHVVELAGLLKQDLPILRDHLNLQCQSLELRTQISLKAIRADRRVTREKLYDEYLEASDAFVATKALCNSLDRFPAALDKMVAAHAALLEDAPTAGQAVQELLVVSNEIAAILAVIK